MSAGACVPFAKHVHTFKRGSTFHRISVWWVGKDLWADVFPLWTEFGELLLYKGVFDLEWWMALSELFSRRHSQWKSPIHYAKGNDVSQGNPTEWNVPLRRLTGLLCCCNPQQFKILHPLVPNIRSETMGNFRICYFINIIIDY